MKRFLLAFLTILLLGGGVAEAQTFHVTKYRWGQTGYIRSQGRERKGGFDIVVDFENRSIVINNKRKPERVTITDMHPTAYEPEMQNVGGVVYCGYSDTCSHVEVYVREKDGEVFQIILTKDGTWFYDVTTE